MTMATKTKRPTRFTVVGHGKFPIDMLRYNGCWPASSEDSRSIQATYESGHSRETFEITLMVAPGYSEPTTARWASFGWMVQS
jgi:hypothetical protein